MLRSLRAGLQAIRRQPLVQTVAIGTVAVALLLVGVVRVAAENVGRMAQAWGRGVQVTVYLEDGVSPARTRRIADAIERLPGVLAVHAVDSHEAYERLRQSLGERASLLDGVEDGLLPPSLEVSFRDGLAGAGALRPELERLRHAAGVEDVELMGDWVDRLLAIERLLTLGGLLLGALVGSACLYIIASTIRLGVFARRQEIEILKLVGATDGFVKGPFLVEGAVQGVVGAALALALLYGLYRAAAPEIARTLGSALCAVPLAFLSPGEVGVALALGALVGLVGSSLAVNRHVRA